MTHRFLYPEQTPLMIAGYNLEYDTIQLLIQQGEDVNQLDKYRENVLNYVLAESADRVLYSDNLVDKTIKIVQLLLKNGINVNHQAYRGNTALHLAITNKPMGDYQQSEQFLLSRCRTQIIQLLLQYNANPLIINSDGFTPAMLAIDNNLPDALSILIKQNELMNVPQGMYNWTLLMWTTNSHGYKIDCVDILLKNGANTSLTNDQGLTALALAFRNGRTKIWKLLLKLGCLEPASLGVLAYNPKEEKPPSSNSFIEARVGNVISASTADIAELQVNDVIIKINEHFIADFYDLGKTINSMQAGMEVTMQVARNGENITTKMMLRPRMAGTLKF